MDREFGFSRRKLLYIGRINNKVLLQSTGNSIQYPVINHMEKNKKRIYMYNSITLLYTRNSHNIVNQLYLNKKLLKTIKREVAPRMKGKRLPWRSSGQDSALPLQGAQV